ncbi:MAG: hypothetical protein A3C02_04635 [Candidatus Andersenbacteria bacterium RIFCSPHIGHO2_02_FULL_45_11]|nr:MAG: hypothetical protein A3C02_04635 [Candidatus Andersenbacteria bacterium RIFCSPHIGHO2_02_FULL_45_11]
MESKPFAWDLLNRGSSKFSGSRAASGAIQIAALLFKRCQIVANVKSLEVATILTMALQSVAARLQDAEVTAGVVFPSLGILSSLNVQTTFFDIRIISAL